MNNPTFREVHAVEIGTRMFDCKISERLVKKIVISSFDNTDVYDLMVKWDDEDNPLESNALLVDLWDLIE